MSAFCTNRKAYFLYTISETIEAGIVLRGNEVKSIRSGLITISGSYAIIQNGELKLLNCSITRYPFSNSSGIKYDELRTRTLLLHNSEIKRLTTKITAKGVTLIPLKVYENKRKIIKIEIGVGKHKKLHDHREKLKERDLDREAKRDMKYYHE